jgi:hypothetical protein
VRGQRGLATPAVPAIAEMTTVAPSADPLWAAAGRIASRLASSASRPAKPGTVGGSCAGTGASGEAARSVAAGAGASSDGSCRRMAVSRSRSAWLGSIPSSSARVERNRW